RSENPRRKNSASRARAGSASLRRTAADTRSATSAGYPIPEPGGVAAGRSGAKLKLRSSFAARAELRQSHDRDGLVRFLVFGRCLQLFASEVEGDDIFLLTQIETQGAPVDGDLSRPDTEEPAKIDHRGTRLAAMIEQDVDDPPHTLAG